MRSMTGFGTAEGKVGRGCLFVEVKSINHRFSEYNIKIPNRMGALESKVREFLQKNFQRGKVDVFFKEKEPFFGGVTITIDWELARKYQDIVGKLKKQMHLSGNTNFLELVGLDRMLKLEEQEGSYEKLWRQIEPLLSRAAKHVSTMQHREGIHIQQDQRQRLKKVESTIKEIHKLSAAALNNNYNKVRKKVAGVGGNGVDEQRLHMEVAYLGGRQDIAEEIVRLESHAKQYSGLINSKEPVGRKLDFLLQEMHREINTIGSKASDAAISKLVVDCKSELERLKEQIQNIE